MYFMAEYNEKPLTMEQLGIIAGLFSVILLILSLATFVPMRIGLKWLENMEL
jgi:hypothetical protein